MPRLAIPQVTALNTPSAVISSYAARTASSAAVCVPTATTTPRPPTRRPAVKAGTASAPSRATDVGSTSPHTTPTASASAATSTSGPARRRDCASWARHPTTADGEQAEQGGALLRPQDGDHQGQQAEPARAGTQAEVLTGPHAHRRCSPFGPGEHREPRFPTH